MTSTNDPAGWRGYGRSWEGATQEEKDEMLKRQFLNPAVWGGTWIPPPEVIDEAIALMRQRQNEYGVEKYDQMMAERFLEEDARRKREEAAAWSSPSPAFTAPPQPAASPTKPAAKAGVPTGAFTFAAKATAGPAPPPPQPVKKHPPMCWCRLGDCPASNQIRCSGPCCTGAKK